MSDDAPEPSPLPKWVTIPVGVFLFLLCLLCLAGSIAVIFLQGAKDAMVNLIVGSVMIAMSLWLLSVSGRMALNLKRRTKGLFSPLALRSIGVVMLIIPFASLVTGAFWEHPVRFSLMAIIYCVIATNLWGLAKSRGNHAEPDA